jgi:hypothetical protein
MHDVNPFGLAADRQAVVPGDQREHTQQVSAKQRGFPGWRPRTLAWGLSDESFQASYLGRLLQLLELSNNHWFSGTLFYQD